MSNQSEQHALFPASIHDPRQWSRYVPGTMERLSPLYHAYTQGIAHDPAIQALVALVDPDQPLPITFYSAVTFLLLRTQRIEHHPFGDFYPVLCQQPRPASAVYPIFRAFCLEHEQDLRALLPTLRLQTNEVTRCANLLPAFHLVFRRGGHRPLALIEIGASAGLNLLWDQYGYTFSRTDSTGVEGVYWSCPSSIPVHLRCRLQGPHVPLFPKQMPPVARRVGIDLHPLDLTSEQDVCWLRACIWPEETRRYMLLDATIEAARWDPPDLLAGDAADLLPAVLKATPLEQTACVWHSYALRQGPAAVRERIEQVLKVQSLQRPISHLSLEMEPGVWEAPRLELFTYEGGACRSAEWLATCEVHGESMTWRSPLCGSSTPRATGARKDACHGSR